MRLRTFNNRLKSKAWRRPSAAFYVSRFSGRQHGTPRDVFERQYGAPAVRALRQSDRNTALWVKVEGYDHRLSSPINGVGEGDPISLIEPRRPTFDFTNFGVEPDYRRLPDGRLELVSISLVPLRGDVP